MSHPSARRNALILLSTYSGGTKSNCPKRPVSSGDPSASSDICVPCVCVRPTAVCVSRDHSAAVWRAARGGWTNTVRTCGSATERAACGGPRGAAVATLIGGRHCWGMSGYEYGDECGYEYEEECGYEYEEECGYEYEEECGYEYEEECGYEYEEECGYEYQEECGYEYE